MSEQTLWALVFFTTVCPLIVVSVTNATYRSRILWAAIAFQCWPCIVLAVLRMSVSVLVYDPTILVLVAFISAPLFWLVSLVLCAVELRGPWKIKGAAIIVALFVVADFAIWMVVQGNIKT